MTGHRSRPTGFRLPSSASVTALAAIAPRWEECRSPKKSEATRRSAAFSNIAVPPEKCIKPNAPGRDPVVTRILWLTGTESRNRNAFRRTIYIHGTPEERRLGAPASYGCIRMGSRDVADLYDRIGHGADVFVIRGSIQSKKTSQSSASLGKTSGRQRG